MCCMKQRESMLDHQHSQERDKRASGHYLEEECAENKKLLSPGEACCLLAYMYVVTSTLLLFYSFVYHPARSTHGSTPRKSMKQLLCLEKENSLKYSHLLYFAGLIPKCTLARSFTCPS